MNPKAVTPWLPPRERHASPPTRPHLVFSSEGTSGTDGRPSDPRRILIVEDDYLIAMQIEAALLDAGLEPVGIAASAEEAVALAASGNPTLAIMDIRLAGQRDGVDAAIDLYRNHGIRSIFATAHGDRAVRERAMPALPLNWLQKPYTMASLVGAIKLALKDLSRKPD